MTDCDNAQIKEAAVTTETVIKAIGDYVEKCDKAFFTTIDIARHMQADERHVRIVFSWLTRYRVVETIPGVRSVRYTGTCGEKYSANVYQVREESTKADFETLNRVFCGR